MSDFESRSQRFVALCMLGVLLFNYPVLALFNVSGAIFGIFGGTLVFLFNRRNQLSVTDYRRRGVTVVCVYT